MIYQRIPCFLLARSALHGGQRTKFSDSFKEIYAWKNSRNRPVGQDESDFQVETQQAELSLKTVYHLEQLSLVDFSNQAAIARLASAIRFANRLKDVDVMGVKPLFSLLENETLRLRPDEITEGNQKDEVLRNAQSTMEDFFVAPPGNIPLKQDHKYGDSMPETSTGSVNNNQKDESSVTLKKARRKA